MQVAEKLYKKGQFADAVDVLELLPDSEEKLTLQAICLANVQRLGEAFETLVKMIETGSKSKKQKTMFSNMTGSMLDYYKQRGDMSTALGLAERAYKTLPDFPAVAYNYGQLLKLVDRKEEAAEVISKLIETHPRELRPYVEIINLYNSVMNLGNVIETANRGLKHIPDSPALLGEKGVALAQMKQYELAQEVFKQALEAPDCTDPDKSRIYTNLGNMYAQQGQIEKALEVNENGIKYDAYNLIAVQNYVMNSLYLPEMTEKEMIKRHLEKGIIYYAAVRKSPKSIPPTVEMALTRRHEKLRVGFVSGDFFRQHPVNYFIGVLLGIREFEIYGYSNEPIRREKYNGNVTWRYIQYLPTGAVCNVIRQDEIDVLFDLSSYSSGNRLDVFCYRNAPVQMSYIGYPHLTGIPEIDYHVVDEHFDPGIKTRCMAHCFTNYQSPPGFFPVLKSTLRGRNFFIIGTLNKAAKINQKLLDSWDKILEAIPELFIVYNDPKVFSVKHKERFYPIEKKKTYEEHMMRYNDMDIALDTWPYSGTTTTCEALFMGVPVITLAPRDAPMHQRVSSSLLINSGLEKLVATSVEEQIDIIREQMEQIRLHPEAYKYSIRNKFLSGNVMNKEQYCEDFKNMVTNAAKERGVN